MIIELFGKMIDSKVGIEILQAIDGNIASNEAMDLCFFEDCNDFEGFKIAMSEEEVNSMIAKANENKEVKVLRENAKVGKFDIAFLGDWETRYGLVIFKLF